MLLTKSHYYSLPNDLEKSLPKPLLNSLGPWRSISSGIFPNFVRASVTLSEIKKYVTVQVSGVTSVEFSVEVDGVNRTYQEVVPPT